MYLRPKTLAERATWKSSRAAATAPGGAQTSAPPQERETISIFPVSRLGCTPVYSGDIDHRGRVARVVALSALTTETNGTPHLASASSSSRRGSPAGFAYTITGHWYL
jgi:hypothetical protein